jgi:hypothetical protein
VKKSALSRVFLVLSIERIRSVKKKVTGRKNVKYAVFVEQQMTEIPEKMEMKSVNVIVGSRED